MLEDIISPIEISGYVFTEWVRRKMRRFHPLLRHLEVGLNLILLTLQASIGRALIQWWTLINHEELLKLTISSSYGDDFDLVLGNQSTIHQMKQFICDIAGSSLETTAAFELHFNGKCLDKQHYSLIEYGISNDSKLTITPTLVAPSFPKC